MGPVFDEFGRTASKEDSLYGVLLIDAIMGGLALIVWIGSWLSYYLTQKGALMIVRGIKKACFEAVLVQESAWFDSVNYSELSSRISSDSKALETGIG